MVYVLVLISNLVDFNLILCSVNQCMSLNASLQCFWHKESEKHLDSFFSCCNFQCEIFSLFCPYNVLTVNSL
jgi:hypothetical protein